MEENKMPEKFLPIGTVVLLKNGKKVWTVTKKRSNIIVNILKRSLL